MKDRMKKLKNIPANQMLSGRHNRLAVWWHVIKIPFHHQEGLLMANVK